MSEFRTPHSVSMRTARALRAETAEPMPKLRFVRTSSLRKKEESASSNMGELRDVE